VKRVEEAHELLDGRLDTATLDANLRDLARVNRWLGGVSLSRKAVVALLRGREGDVELLDVGTGAADIPDALIGSLGGPGHWLRVTAVDTRTEILGAARRRSRAGPATLKLERVSGDRLPYPDAAFDIAHCSLVLHHAEKDGALRLLQEMARVSRVGVVVNDLERSRRAWLGAWMLTRVATRNRYTRHDAPLSVRRSFLPAEVAQIAARAGLIETARFRDLFRHRFAIAFVPAARPPDAVAARGTDGAATTDAGAEADHPAGG
jgi:ubiquinone/menaquinone biosynthesis C-methylase UbiE